MYDAIDTIFCDLNFDVQIGFADLIVGTPGPRYVEVFVSPI
jgi:hypothetical protein